MEPEVISIEDALKALAILITIPIILFALWAESFDQRVKELLAENPKLECEPEVERLRTASLFVTLFQFALFLGSSELREAYPLATYGIFSAAVVTQLILHSYHEKKIRPKGSDDLVGLMIRAILSWVIGVSIHLAILLVNLRIASVIAQQMKASTTVSAVLFLSAAAVGLILGIIINFAFGPVYVKKSLPTRALENSDLAARFEACFMRAGLNPPRFLVVDLEKIPLVNVFSIGFLSAPGFLRASVFICRHAFKALTDTELDALILNEVSHLTLKNFKNRFLLISGLISMTTLVSIVSMVIAQRVFPTEIALGLVTPVITLLSFALSLRLISNQQKNQEFRTDIYCIEKLGVSIDDLESAWRKLDITAIRTLNPSQQLAILNHGYPETERRIRLIRDHFGQKEERKAA